jgi:formylmethanofuran dehydrogenase subunit C
VKPLVLQLRTAPDERLDLSGLVPHLLSGKRVPEIERIAINTTKHRIVVGDVFRVRPGAPDSIRIEGSSARLDRIGVEMQNGEIVVEGDAGVQAGRRMQGGRLTIEGSAGPWAASGMAGGLVQISGTAGERLGGSLPGETSGMRGGVVLVRGAVADRVGDHMRRGTIIVEGNAADYPGSRMIAGTLIVCGSCAALPGYLMRRGTIVIGNDYAELSPTFADCGIHPLVALRLMARFVRGYSARAATVLSRPLRRWAGDMAVLGKGELFTGVR